MTQGKPGRAEKESAGGGAVTDGAEPLSVLNAIAAEASRTLNLTELLDLGLQQMIDLTGMESGAVMLVDEDTQLITLAAERNLPEAARDLIQREPLPVGETIPGIAAQRCQLLIVENSKDDERELPPFREFGVMTHICIPLAVRGRALGVLGLIDRRSRTFSASDLALFTGVGEQLGIAVERARLLDQQAKLAERAQVLDELMRVAVSGLDMAEAFDRIGEQVKRLVDFDRLSIAIHPQDQEYYEAYAVTGEGPEAGARCPIQDSVVGEAIRTGHPIVRENVREDGVYPDEIEVSKTYSVRSTMFVPLRSKGLVLGTLNFGSRRPGSFGDPELQIAQEIADHLAVIVEHALLDEQSKEADAALRRLNKQLQDANRHKSEFLANLSHELRTPLNAILGASELLHEGLFGELNEKQMEYIGDIHQGGKHLLSLINDVLDLSKVEAGKLDLHVDHFDLRSLMESSAVIVRERATVKSLELRVEPPPEDVIVEADQRKIKQVVYNLLSNAVKFTPVNGKVTFRARREGDEVIFAIEDNGPGVAEEFQERIFEEFVQTPDSREGTGLGLALSKRLVELHGGRIWLESREGRGSRFFFAIPTAQPASSGSGDLSATQ